MRDAVQPAANGGRHSRRRLPWAASSAARAASRLRISATSSSDVPSGTVVTMSTRNSTAPLSGSERVAAHRFYGSRGYRRVKTEQLFAKVIQLG
jgi:hypothetical protein